MKKISTMIVMVCISLVFAKFSFAGEATPQEIVQKVEEAVKLIEEKGEEAFPTIRDPQGPFIWKDSYIFVYNMDGMIVAHANPKLENKNLIGIKDVKGNMFAAEFVAIAKSETGKGWSEYWWPKLGEKEASRKISYIMKVPGKDYFAGAGVYSDLSKEEVIKMTQQSQ